MVLDIIISIALIFAIIKGYQRGLIVALFSILAFIIGIAAAMKLSTVVANYIGEESGISEKWLPVLAFILVFVIVVLIIRWAAVLIEKSVQLAMLGWMNRLGGIILFCALYILIFSVLIFYADQLSLIKAKTRNESIAYSYIQPWGQKIIDGFGKIIPVFNGMFEDLKDFFGNVANQLPEAK